MFLGAFRKTIGLFLIALRNRYSFNNNTSVLGLDGNHCCLRSNNTEYIGFYVKEALKYENSCI